MKSKLAEKIIAIHAEYVGENGLITGNDAKEAAREVIGFNLRIGAALMERAEEMDCPMDLSSFKSTIDRLASE